jgi:hypothetical protein
VVRLLGVLLAALAVAAPANGAVLLGAHGDGDRLDSLTRAEHDVGHVIMGWGQATGARLDRLLANNGPIPLLGIKTGPLGGETITPAQIAAGQGDAFLFDLNRAAAAWPGTIYVRPLPEMNGHWNPYCAFNRDGSRRGAAHSTARFKKAFARIYLLVHGGPAATVNARLRRLGLPTISRDLPSNPYPRVRVVWNPQGYGSPNLAGNSAQAYYPGDAYVDVVGNDLYHINGKAEWAAADRLYRAHPRKPYSFPEWGLWGGDDPSFIRRMAAFVKAHPRTELLAWFTSKPGSIFDLASKPRSLAAYRQLIAPLG